MNSASEHHRVEHGGALAAACRQFGGRPGEWLDLSTGINPNPVDLPEIDPRAWQRLPDDDLFEGAAAAAATYYGAAEGVVPLPVAGTQSVIQTLPALFQGRVAVFGPTYEEYRFRFQRAGIPVDVISGTGEIHEQHRLVIVVNPNNPDGRVLSRETITGIAAMLADRGGHIIVDEAFADCDDEQSVTALAGKLANLIVLRSFGKFFGLAGLRLGFLFASPRTVRRFRDEQGPWAVSGPALALATGILGNPALIASNRDAIARRREGLGHLLERAGLKTAGGTQLFVLVEDNRAEEIHHLLCRRRILTRKFGHTPHWLRIGLCPDPAAEERLGAALAALDVQG